MLKTAKHWIEKLRLEAHPEGGYFKETYRAVERIERGALPSRFTGARNYSTAIYYLLRNNDFSSWHRIKSDEMWHYYDGNSAIEIHVLSQMGQHEILLLGNDIDKHENFQVVVPANSWFAASLSKQNSFALVGCTVSPGFHFDDFEMARVEDLIQGFPGHNEMIRKYSRQ